MFYYLYQVTNKVNGKIYVGVHKTKDLGDGYMGSGKVIKLAIEKHGLENFVKVILESFEDQEAMYAREKEIVDEEFLARPDTYNLRRGGQGGFDYLNKYFPAPFKGNRHSEEVRVFLREKAKNQKHSVETKKKISENNWAKTAPEVQRKHSAEIAKSRIRTVEENLKISESLKGRSSPKRDVTCPWCNKVGKDNIMRRWHFDNCKIKGAAEGCGGSLQDS